MEKRRSIVGTPSHTTQTPTTSNTRADSHDSIKKFETEPDSYLQFRLQIEKKLAYSFRGLWANSNAAEEFTQNAKQHMTNKIDDPQALKALLPTEYKAATVAGFPNHFVNGSAYPGIERTSDYITRVIDRLQKDRLRSVCIKQSAQDAFNRWVQSRMPEMVWAEPCSSWYKLPSGKVIVPWPGTILHYYAATEIVRWEDYDLKFDEDEQKFASFGNGITVEGFTPDSIPWLRYN
ncbi:hypothetical protein FOXG_14845 [Fusarium oxysporum f. sp. lycopersici 4287]|uniref:Uncharacterized protein n=2 Tax=Fusarium oxysporum TaxID=5507 RepID=A0A0J9W1T3_FUSO4|nr:hypothetical protein FOXG_14845 [Fusarium oxysporum f. sp. lycopersici 4287]KNB16785.1 hypothetical protein FOXG_14845 [Fusarium oxysporum f. sp. lycopersici 4287]